jgi:hypothetical protein
MKAELELNANPFVASAQRINRAVENMQARFAVLSLDMQGVKEVFSAVAEQFEHVKEQFEMGAQLANLKEQTGQSVADLVVLRQAFVNAGLGADDVGGKLNRLQKALAGLNENGEKTEGVLKELGTSVQALGGMSAIKQIETLQGGFAKVKSQADRVLLAQKLFGKSGGELLALFANPETLAKAKQQTGGLAQTMDRNAEKFREIAESLESVKIKMDQFWAGVAEGVAPALAGVANSIVKLDFTEIGRSVGIAVAAFMELASALKNLIPLFAGFAVGSSLGFLKTLPSLLTLIAGRFAVMSEVATASGAAMKAAFGPVGIAVAAAVEGFMYLQGRSSKMNRESSAMGEIGAERSTYGKDESAAIRGVDSEESRSAIAEDLAKKLGEVKERMAGVNKEFADLGKDGQARIRESLEAWALQIQNFQRILSHASLHPAPDTGEPIFSHHQVSSRVRAGGGIYQGIRGVRAGDPVLSETRRTNVILMRIHDRLPGNPNTTSRMPPANASY